MASRLNNNIPKYQSIINESIFRLLEKRGKVLDFTLLFLLRVLVFKMEVLFSLDFFMAKQV